MCFLSVPFAIRRCIWIFNVAQGQSQLGLCMIGRARAHYSCYCRFGLCSAQTVFFVKIKTQNSVALTHFESLVSFWRYSFFNWYYGSSWVKRERAALFCAPSFNGTTFLFARMSFGVSHLIFFGCIRLLLIIYIINHGFVVLSCTQFVDIFLS